MRQQCVTSVKKSRKNLQNKDFISVVLLCDSPGYRMKSYGPIPLITINNQRLIDIQISIIESAFPNCEIILCLGFDAEKIYKYIRSKHSDKNIRIVENQLYDISNSCESLRLSLNNIYNEKNFYI